MRHTLKLLLLACWQLGEAASPLDISRWALDGRLPYLNFAADEGRQLAQFRTILGPDFIIIKGLLLLLLLRLLLLLLRCCCCRRPCAAAPASPAAPLCLPLPVLLPVVGCTCQLGTVTA